MAYKPFHDVSFLEACGTRAFSALCTSFGPVFLKVQVGRRGEGFRVDCSGREPSV